jgi:hypothetical protein
LTLSAGAGGNSTTPGTGGNIIFQSGPNATVAEHLRVANSGNVLVTSGQLQVGTGGFGLSVKAGANDKLGTAQLSAGTVTVNNSSITSNSVIFLTSQSDGGTPGFVRVTAKVTSTSFTITSSSNTDTSTIAWMIVEEM